ncbi:MAG TPA: hypothetical protein VLV89_10370 [Candidatus Acidoferrum sp.]|nr:hypothetical protein [Candidatus Acidoferrum sp.]
MIFLDESDITVYSDYVQVTKKNGELARAVAMLNGEGSYSPENYGHILFMRSVAPRREIHFPEKYEHTPTSGKDLTPAHLKFLKEKTEREKPDAPQSPVGEFIEYERAGRQLGERLRAWTDEWIALKRDSSRWLARHPEFPRLLERFGVAIENANIVIRQNSKPRSPIQEAKLDAARAMVFVLTATASVLRCPSCSRYFATSRPDKVYCTRRCATHFTATRATLRHLAEERARKLEALRRALRSCPRSAKDWKAWVSKKTGVAKIFITRSLNRGEIRLPKGRKR